MAKPANAAVPPMNLEAEESVLGAMMLNPNAIDAVSPILRAADFYRAQTHGRIYEVALALHAAGEPVDAITVVDRLEALDELEKVGGRGRIHELAALVPATSNAAHYARIVREAATFRGLIRAGGEIQRLGYDRPDPADELVARAETLVFELSEERQNHDFVTVGEVARETLARLSELAESGAEIVGLPTGYKDLDRMLSGLRPGQLAVVAGRPSMGKTAFALGIIQHAILHEEPVALFTFEMSRWEVMQRLLSMEARVNSDGLQTPSRLTGEEWMRVVETSGKIAATPLYIEDAPCTMLEVASKARRLKARIPRLSLIVVDYLQLMDSGLSAERRDLEVGQISRGLKMLAGELQIPVVAVSQIGRGTERRHDNRPMLADLRDSGAIEQDADLVLLLYRAEYYFPDDEELQGIAEVHVAKHRNGPVGVRKLAFVSRYAAFSELARLPFEGES